MFTLLELIDKIYEDWKSGGAFGAIVGLLRLVVGIALVFGGVFVFCFGALAIYDGRWLVGIAMVTGGIVCAIGSFPIAMGPDRDSNK